MTQDAAPAGLNFKEAISRPEALWIVMSNAIPIFGVLFLEWPAFSLLLFYWIENVVIGIFNVIKVAISGVNKGVVVITAFLVPFFCVHYGLFCYVHGVFLLAMFMFADALPGAGDAGVGPMELLPTVWQQLTLDADLRVSVIVLVAVQAAWFVVLWLGTGKWRTANPMVQMFEPYGRIVIMHLTIFVATIPVLMLGEALIAVVALAVMKGGLELGLPQFSFGLDKIKEFPMDKLSDK